MGKKYIYFNVTTLPMQKSIIIKTKKLLNFLAKATLLGGGRVGVST